jgi:lysine 6-dehydrogenase
MGRIAVRDLVETARDNWTVVVADRDVRTAKEVAAGSVRKGRVRVVAASADVRDVRATARLLEGSFAVIAAVQHVYNLLVMNAALAARAHYVDLGGLFHVTRKQLSLHRQFVRADRLAILGMGAAPGIVNILARSIADRLDAVKEIQILVGNVDRTKGRPLGPLAVSYSFETVLDEASQPAAIFTGRKFKFVPPMSGAIDVEFPEPVGHRRPAFTLHSEVATLPLSFRKKGIAECSFRIAFPDELADRLGFLRAIGLLSTEPLRVGSTRVVPHDVLIALLRHQPAQPPFRGVPDEYEILRVVGRGTKAGANVVETADCHVPGMPEWGLGLDVDTGCPPSIAVQMLARGEIEARGCLPPERAVPPEPFFAELARRGMTIRRSSS